MFTDKLNPLRESLWLLGFLAVWISFAAADLPAQEAVETRSPNAFDPPEGLPRLARDADVWLDLERKLVIVDGYVAIREGALEMFACPQGTKEHESIVAVRGAARFVHAALLAIGARTGQPVQFEPEYSPARGTVVNVFVLYRDEEGQNKRVRAQEWIKNTKTGEPMQHSWVFAGSSFWKDPVDGKRYYSADAGDLICVSNFPTATLDLPIQSSQETGQLLFEAYTERIPPRKTPVRLVLMPDHEPESVPASETEPAEPKPEKASARSASDPDDAE